MNEVIMETVDCALCGGKESSSIYETMDRNWRVPGNFRVVKCHGCGLVYVNPRPGVNDIGKYYPETFMVRSRLVDTEVEEMKMHGRPWKEIMGILAAPLLKHSPKGRVLDIGSGDGLFLGYMKSVGWEAFGAEPRKAAAEASEKQFGITVFPGMLHDAPFEKGSFDAVTLNNVFEHVHNPVELLEQVKEFLKPDGLLMIDVPNFNSLESRLFGDRWVALDVPRHLYHYTRKTLVAMLEKGGFSTVEVFEDSDAGPYKMGYVESLRYAIMDMGLKKYPDKKTSLDELKESRSAGGSTSSVGVKNLAHRLEGLFFALVGTAAKQFGGGSRLILIATNYKIKSR